VKPPTPVQFAIGTLVLLPSLDPSLTQVSAGLIPLL